MSSPKFNPKKEIPFVSVIVPAYNVASIIRRCLKSLVNQDYPSSRREILVVDNGSSDKTTQIVKQFPVELLQLPKPNPAQARNFGIKKAQGELVAFTDSDCEAQPDWLSELVKALQKHKAAAVGGKMLSPPSGRALDRFFELVIKNQEAFLSSSCHPQPFIDTANSIFKKKALLEVGLFDSSFPISAHEDVDLSWRLLEHDYKLVGAPKAIIIHHHKSSLMGLYNLQFKYGASLSNLYAKHAGKFSPKLVQRCLGVTLADHDIFYYQLGQVLKAIISNKRGDDLIFPWFFIWSQMGFIAGKIRGMLPFGKPPSASVIG